MLPLFYIFLTVYVHLYNSFTVAL